MQKNTWERTYTVFFIGRIFLFRIPKNHSSSFSPSRRAETWNKLIMSRYIAETSYEPPHSRLHKASCQLSVSYFCIATEPQPPNAPFIRYCFSKRFRYEHIHPSGTMAIMLTSDAALNFICRGTATSSNNASTHSLTHFQQWTDNER